MNTGACDDLRGRDLAHEHGAWVHVDGAFGLWAAASPALRHLLDGVELADSWGCDGHKWLNVPYDSGFVFCAAPDVHATSMSLHRAYLTGRAASAGTADLTAESSRRARGFAAWAALRELGRHGVAELVDRCCGSPAASPTAWPPAAPRSSTTWCSTRSWSASAMTPAPTASSRRSSRRHLLARRHDLAGPPADAGLGVQPSTREADVDRSVEAISRLLAELG